MTKKSIIKVVHISCVAYVWQTEIQDIILTSTLSPLCVLMREVNVQFMNESIDPVHKTTLNDKFRLNQTDPILQNQTDSCIDL